MNYVTCIKCGWVSFSVSRKYAEEQIKKFSDYFDSLSKEKQKEFYNGKKFSLKDYSCMLCGGLKFRKFQNGDCPDGCTLNPVICEEID